jgi:16S rRNA (adenine1518-N6/adenine1519-N6)-dimethyltransferase
MLQREVADRLLAAPGTRDYGVLTVLIRHVAAVERLLQLPAGAFRPQPKVLSTVVRLRFQPPDPAVADPHVFAAMTHAMFTRRRKTLANALLAYSAPGSTRPEDALAAAGIDPQRRPETLAIAEVAALADAYADAARRAVL